LSRRFLILRELDDSACWGKFLAPIVRFKPTLGRHQREYGGIFANRFWPLKFFSVVMIALGMVAEEGLKKKRLFQTHNILLLSNLY
jgi:hypothetical protein